MARATMASLISRLRRMVGDTAASPTFSDDELQDALDAQQTVIFYELLTPVPSQVGGSLLYLAFASSHSNFEDTPTLTNASGGQVTPSTANLLTGVFTFATGQDATMYLSGNAYDMAGSAADVCDQWAAALSRSYDVRDDNTDLKRSQMAKSLREQAKAYRQQQGVIQSTSSRSDVGRDYSTLYSDRRPY